jgi:hypothetical protein
MCPLRSPAPGCLMDRADILELMTRLKLYGVRAAYDEVMTTGIKRRHEPARIVGELADAGHDLAFRKMAVAHDALLARLGLEIGVLCEKLSNLRFDRLGQQRTPRRSAGSL